MTEEEKTVLAVIKSHAPSYWWSPANKAFGKDPNVNHSTLESLTAKGLLRRSGGSSPSLYALKESS